jgi:hypothetical protein
MGRLVKGNNDFDEIAVATLRELLQTRSKDQCAKNMGICDNTVMKRCKKAIKIITFNAGVSPEERDIIGANIRAMLLRSSLLWKYIDDWENKVDPPLVPIQGLTIPEFVALVKQSVYDAVLETMPLDYQRLKFLRRRDALALKNKEKFPRIYEAPKREKPTGQDSGA